MEGIAFIAVCCLVSWFLVHRERDARDSRVRSTVEMIDVDEQEFRVRFSIVGVGKDRRLRAEVDARTATGWRGVGEYDEAYRGVADNLAQSDPYSDVALSRMAYGLVAHVSDEALEGPPPGGRLRLHPGGPTLAYPKRIPARPRPGQAWLEHNGQEYVAYRGDGTEYGRARRLADALTLRDPAEAPPR